MEKSFLLIFVFFGVSIALLSDIVPLILNVNHCFNDPNMPITNSTQMTKAQLCEYNIVHYHKLWGLIG